jgi:lipopolysaccharide/colanic/teichoic acid biosynthesis glycosyltransferase
MLISVSRSRSLSEVTPRVAEKRGWPAPPFSLTLPELTKRLIDLVFATGLLVVTLPLGLAIGLGVKLNSPGPVLFRHRRVGLAGRSFSCLKFRTMVQDAEEWLERDGALRATYRSNGFKLPAEADPRVTGFGRVLRRTHLDELPQLINVLAGDLSLVGPRPIITEELDFFPDSDRDQLLSVRPGIFGLWTALGRNRVNYPERAAIELRYVETRSNAGDIAILLRHLPVLLHGQSD